MMKNAIRRSTGLILLLFIGSPLVYAQQHGQQRMMMPRVPADKMEEARAMTSPLPQSSEIVEQGKAIYEGKGTCANCHGTSGRGDGPGGANLNPPPRVLGAHGFWRHRSEGEIFWVIKYGSPGTGMIPFGGLLADEEIWTVMQYERSFAGGPQHGGESHRGGGRHKGGGMMQHQGEGEGHGEEKGMKSSADLPAGQASGSMGKAEKAQAASIIITQAIAAANNHVPGTVLEAEFEAKEDQSFWEVEIATGDGKLMEVKVDSQTGAILSSEEEEPEYDKKHKRKQKGKGHQGSKGKHRGGEGGGMGGGGMEGGQMGGGHMNGHKQE
jgi:mono/diheme cytochrome c family protein